MGSGDYRPAAEVLEQIKQVDFVAVVGPTAGGKTTITKAAASQTDKIHFVLTDISRAPRPGEQDGVDYRFTNHKAMQDRAAKGGYVNFAQGVPPDLYAISPEGLDLTRVNIMAIWSKEIAYFRSLPFRSFRVMYIVPSDGAVWRERILARGFEADQLRKRLGEVGDSLRFALSEQCVFVINGKLDRAAEDFLTLALNRPMPERLQADQRRARRLVQDLLKQLENDFKDVTN